MPYTFIVLSNIQKQSLVLYNEYLKRHSSVKITQTSNYQIIRHKFYIHF